MTLFQQIDMSPAAWIVSAAEMDGWAKVAVSGPRGFSEYARLRFIPDPSFAGQREIDVDFNRSGPLASERSQIDVATSILNGHTTTPGQHYFAMWTGGINTAVPSPESVFSIPNREYFLMSEGLDETGSDPAIHRQMEVDPLPNPAFIWPADASWIIAKDVDPHFATIGASSEAVHQLLHSRLIDTVRYDWATVPPYYL